MSISIVILILALSVIFLIGSVITLALEFNSYKRAQRATLALQLNQQLQMPVLAQAVETIRTLAMPDMNGHGGPAHAAPALMNGQWQAVKEVNRYFTHVGELLRSGVADDEVFALMGPTISEMWHLSKSHRTKLAEKDDIPIVKDDFDYLYVEWLNYDHRRRTTSGGFSPA
jgi:hypothetical protein